MRVHVVCGGGTGGRLLRRLMGPRFEVTVGLLGSEDDDARTARSLGFRSLEARIASPFPAELVTAVREAMLRADAIVVTPFAVGRGNLINLELATDAASVRPVFLLEGGEIAKRDYTEGRATELYGILRRRARGASPDAAVLVAQVTAVRPSEYPG